MVAPQTFGLFVVHEQIGAGGMATVHRAEMQRKDGSRVAVALKRLPPSAAMNKQLVSSFVREARVMKYLDHPNVATSYDSGKLLGSHFIAMEYVPGPTLKELVDQAAATANKVPIQVTLNIARQICDALDHTHTRTGEKGEPLGIIHRDVSPANIILAKDGLVKLVDFGLAKIKILTSDTGEGVIKGKFSYVAPEYLGGSLDSRADLWALGVVIYELLTSRPLFDAHDDFETMQRVRAMPIPRPSRANPRVPPELDTIVMKLLERDPARRWQTAAELRDALAAVAAKPGNTFENRQVINWVDWVFAQGPGGKEQSALANMFAVEAEPAMSLGIPAARPVNIAPPPVQEEPPPIPKRWLLIAAAVVAVLLIIALIAS